MSNPAEKVVSGSRDPESNPIGSEDTSQEFSVKGELAHERTSSVNDDQQSNKSHEGREAVSRVDVVAQVLSTYGATEMFGIHVQPLKVLLLVLMFFQAYGANLDGLLSGTWQTYAANNFKDSAASGSINTIKSVVAAAVLVPYARLSDRFGRVETWILACLFFTVGRVVTAATPTFGGLYAGSVVWEFGYAGFRMLATALTADLSGLKDRTFFMNIYLIPIIINLWISGNITQSLIDKGSWYWRWGYGMFAIIVPIVTAVFTLPYFFAQRVAKRQNILPPLRLRKGNESIGRALWDLALDIDVIGVLLFAAALVLVLLPLTIAGGAESKWDRGYIIAMICVGGFLIIPFVIWELWYARAPFIPRRRLEVTFYAAMAFELFWRVAISLELNYVRFILLVAFNQSTSSAQRLGQLYDFMQACTNIGVGIILHFWPHPKFFVFTGSLVGLLGMGLMYKYRVAYDGLSGYIAADVLIGLGGGMMRFPTWTLVHTGVPHDQMAVATGFMMTMYQVGAAVGSCVATAVWTQKLAPKLIELLGPQLGQQVYKSPLNFTKKYPIGTPTRDKILEAYSYIQRLLMIVALAFTALVVVITLFVRNYTVTDNNAMTDEEREIERKRIRSSKWFWLRWVVGY